MYLNRLGQGASGVVDKKIDAVSLELVAVKQVALNDAEAVKSIVAELNILKGNPANEGGHQLEGSIRNLVALYGCYFDRGTNQLCLVMEYCEGGSPQDLIDTGEPPAGEPRDHRPGRVHGAVVHPRAWEDPPRHQARQPAHRPHRPRQGRRLRPRGRGGQPPGRDPAGTTTYMSPERLKGEPYSSAADVWGVGLSFVHGRPGRPHRRARGPGHWFLYRALCEAEDPGRQIDRWLEAHREHLNAFGDPRARDHSHGSLPSGARVMPGTATTTCAPSSRPPALGAAGHGRLPGPESALMYSPRWPRTRSRRHSCSCCGASSCGSRRAGPRASSSRRTLLRDPQLEDEEAYYEPDAEDAGAGEDVDEEELDAIVEKVFDFLEKSRAVDLGGTYGQHSPGACPGRQRVACPGWTPLGARHQGAAEVPRLLARAGGSSSSAVAAVRQPRARPPPPQMK